MPELIKNPTQVGKGFHARAAVVAFIVNTFVPKLEALEIGSEIADAYKKMVPVNRIATIIANRYPGEFEGNPKILASAIRYLIRDLLSENERKEIEFRHRSRHAAEINLMRIGIFAQTEEQRSENGKRGGSTAGKAAFKNRTGIFSLSKEEKTANGRKGASASIEKSGGVMWKRDGNNESEGKNEIDYCIHLSVHHEYLFPSPGSNGGHPNCKKIADCLNRIFHGGSAIRSASQVRIKLCKERIKRRLSVP